MSAIIKCLALTSAVFFTAGVLYSAPAAAQATRTWVSGVGDDANPCSRTAPCKTFAGAISKTNAGGTINCLDPGGWGTFAITKAITIDCEQFPGSVLNASGTGIVINAGVNDAVTIRGLTIAGGIGGSGTFGIRVQAAGSVLIENVKIFNQAQASPNGFAIFVAPSTGNVQVTVTRSTISGSASGGIQIAPTGDVPVDLYVSDTEFDGNSGPAVGLTTSGGGTVLTAVIVNSSITGSRAANSNGVIAKATTGTATITISGSTIANNVRTAVAANGAGATVRVGSSTITGNVTGVSALNGGSVVSFGNNQVSGNVTPGLFTSTSPTS